MEFCGNVWEFDQLLPEFHVSAVAAYDTVLDVVRNDHIAISFSSKTDMKQVAGCLDEVEYAVQYLDWLRNGRSHDIDRR